MGEGWTSLDDIRDRQEGLDILPLVEEAVGRMHGARWEGSPIAHGDLRPPNLMWHRESKTIMIVDLEWSGKAGVRRYPARMSDAVSWHDSAKPGQVLLQEHDVHMLKKMYL